MKYKYIENTSKRSLLIDTPSGGTVSIPAGTTLNDIELDEVQVSNFEDIKMLKAVKAVKAEKAEKKEEIIVLPAEFTADSLAATFTDEQLKAYCKFNKITGITGKKGAELAELIVSDYAAKADLVLGQKEEK